MRFEPISTEWCDSNLSRSYPLDDITGGMPNTLPCRLLVDAVFYTINVDRSSLYISSVQNLTHAVVLSLAAKTLDGDDVTFKDVITLHRTFDKYAQIEFNALSDDAEMSASISGTVTIGDMLSTDSLPANLELTVESGKIFPGIVMPADAICVRTIKVNGVSLHGDITIVSDGTVAIDVDPDTNTIQLSSDISDEIDRLLADSNRSIISDEALFNRATEYFGSPITSISGVTPDANGNISIATPYSLDSSSTQTVEDINSDSIVPDNSATAATLTLTLARDPLLEAGTVKKLLDNLDQLSTRCAEIDRAQTAIDAQLSATAGRLTRL